ncbi:hypothetical protein LUZ63_007598 [Rhynchospora breviuscula]|uniref:Peroxidase n=1 Tax=Rhynchospora breviuscula TaxID=2022672 RepID=A0A9Q0HUQ0_9POAL|nr:hypothetical protein LUZ63_007598 [Rhynchospora breviuscula]
MALLALVAILFCLGTSTNAQLSTSYYSYTCPNLSSTVQSVMQSAISRDARVGAALVRLFYHDCFVNGCDGSILLDDTSTFTGEKTAGPNKDSLTTKVFQVVDDIKTAVENACSGVVSCADIVALAAMDSVSILGGPSWNVKLGRRDSTTASLSGANSNIPGPSSSLQNLISSFNSQGLSANEMVALSGAHTIGQARCSTFRSHIYSDTNIYGSFASQLQSNCPSTSGSGDDNLSPLDVQTPTRFDNNYYKNLQKFEGLLHSDQELYNNGSTDSLVATYSNDASTFSSDFAAAMIKLGDINPLTGSQGQIRKNCRVVN